MGNTKIPGTGIELVNYTVSPQCKSTFSFQETQAYYRNPVLDPKQSKRQQMREDTRFKCHNCGTFFFPALVMVDKAKPQNEYQFLCRIQTVQAVKTYYMINYKQKVLTKKVNCQYHKEKETCVLNDVHIHEMLSAPTLISNIIQYTPYNYIFNFINDQHYMKDPIFGHWISRN